MWLVVHIYFLAGFQNRALVFLKWAWSYLSFRRGARLIVSKDWRFYRSQESINSADCLPVKNNKP
jgi:NADH dehydrogenase